MTSMCRKSRSTGSPIHCFLLVLTLAGALLASSAQGAMVRSLDLDDLSAQADRIFRGTVISVEPGSAEVGGGQVPTVVYRLRVIEAFKGSFDQEDGQLFAELRMVTSPQGEDSDGASRSKAFAFMPHLELGGEYLLMITKPSSAGLSAPVGLGQGSFRIDGSGDQARVRNGFGNAGLSGDPPGDESPRAVVEMTYRELADRLHRSLQTSKREAVVEKVQR